MYYKIIEIFQGLIMCLPANFVSNHKNIFIAVGSGGIATAGVATVAGVFFLTVMVAFPHSSLGIVGNAYTVSASLLMAFVADIIGSGILILNCLGKKKPTLAGGSGGEDAFDRFLQAAEFNRDDFSLDALIDEANQIRVIALKSNDHKMLALLKNLDSLIPLLELEKERIDENTSTAPINFVPTLMAVQQNLKDIRESNEG